VKHTLATILIAALVSGCAVIKPKVLASTPRSVHIHAGKMSEAMPLAQTECQRHGRHARWSRGSDIDGDFVFDCVN